MALVVGKNVIYDIDQTIPSKSELYSFENMSVSNIINVRHDPIDGDVVDYQIKFAINTTQFRVTQENADYARINSFDVKIYVNKIQVAREEINANQVIDKNGFLQEMLTYFTIKKKELDSAAANVSLIVSATSSRGTNIPGLSIQEKIDYIADKKRYFIPNNEVKISVAPSSFNSFLVTVIKPPRTNIQGVKITRKLAGEDRTRRKVREINFKTELGSNIGEELVYQFIDSGNSFEDTKNKEPGTLDAFLSYEYRAVPIGYEGVQGNRFFDAATEPIQHTSVLTGENLEVLSSASDRSKVGLVDKNIIAVGNPKELPSQLDIVSQVSETGVLVQVHDIPSDHYANIVRKNITEGDTSFSRLDSPEANGIFGGGQKGIVTFIDTTALSETTYEYACEIVSMSGASSMSFDTTTITHIDLKTISFPGINTRVSLVSQDFNQVVFTITTEIPEGQIDAVTRELQDRGIKSNFDQDIQDNRSSLQNSIAYKVVKLNLSTGEENDFLSSDGIYPGFENNDESEKVSTVKSVTFTDDQVEQDSKYRYIVITLLRDIEQLLETKIPVIDNNNSFISFPAKNLHPLALRRGILPPTKAGKFFDLGLVKNENSNPKRLLDYFTPLSEFELGEISSRAFLPDEDGVIMIQRPGNQLFIVPELLKTSAPSTIFNWTLSRTPSVSSFEIVITDRYFDKRGVKLAERSSVQPSFPNDNRTNYHSEDIIETFTSKDIQDSRIVTFDTNILDALNNTVRVLRDYSITPTYFDGKKGQPQTSQPVNISSETLV